MATTLGAVAEGNIVYLNESGVAVPFYVAKHNYESALNGDGRTLLVRKDCYDTRAWHSSDVNAYASSSVDNWLNSTYKALLDANVQSAIGTTKFYYTPGNGNTSVTALTRGIFLLSLTELGKSTGNANTEGSALPIASTLQIAYRNESVVSQWTRSPLTNQTAATFALSTSGNILGVNCTAAHGSRPAFTLPSTMEIGENGSEYTWLEWIESDAASYIDTGFIPNSNTRVVADIETATSFSANKWVFGQRSNSNTQRYEVIYIASADEIRFYVNTSNYAFSGVKLGRLYIDVSAASATINGVTVTPSVSSFSGARTLYICDCNSNATSNEAIEQKVYSFQIYDNNTLVRDFIPARRNSDGAVGLLDQANNVFYGNAGTGTFTAGPVAEYTWLEYIESSGTQWIDTGFVPNQDTRVVFDFEYTKAVSGAQQGVFGSRIALRNAMYLMWTENGNAGWRDGYGTELKYPIGSTISGRVVVDKNKNALSINGTVVYTATYATFNSTYSLYLLTTNNAGSPMIDSYPTYARIYACQIYDNGTLVRDLVPAKRSDGTVGLYDKVNDRFYTNSGTGAFTAGPEIVAARSLAMIDDTEYPLVQGYVRVNDIRYPLLYALVLIDDVEYTAPFGDAQQTISFYIETDNDSGVYEEYQAENGMTWAEWVESEYNTDGFYVKTYGNYTWIERTINNTAISVQDTSGDDVQPSDTIVSDYQYQAAWVI